jgi:hypothetical protein
LVLSAALDYIEDEAEAVSRREGSYLQWMVRSSSTLNLEAVTASG